MTARGCFTVGLYLVNSVVQTAGYTATVTLFTPGFNMASWVIHPQVDSRDTSLFAPVSVSTVSSWPLLFRFTATFVSQLLTKKAKKLQELTGVFFFFFSSQSTTTSCIDEVCSCYLPVRDTSGCISIYATKDMWSHAFQTTSGWILVVVQTCV